MILDLVAGILIAYGFYQGFTKGLIKTVFATLSLIIAVVAALKLSPILIGILQRTFSTMPAISFVLGFVLTFIFVIVIVRFIGNKIEKAMESLHIGGLNKLAGGLVLSLFYAILLSIGVFFIDKIELLSDKQKSASYAYPLLEPLPRITRGVGENLRPVFTEFWDKLIVTMDQAKLKAEELEQKNGN